MLRRAEAVGSSNEGSDNTVLGGVGCAGGVLHVEVGVCRLAVDGCRFIRVYQDVEVRECAVGGRMFDRVLQIRVEGVDVGEEGIAKAPIPSSTKCL